MDEGSLKTWLDTIAASWEKVAAIIAGLAAIGGYWAVTKRKSLSMSRWLKNVLDAPNAIARINTQLTFPNGKLIGERLDDLDSHLSGLRQMMANETSNRRAYLQRLTEPIFECSATGEFIWANTAFLKRVSISLTQVLGLNWQNCIIALPDRGKGCRRLEQGGKRRHGLSRQVSPSFGRG